MRWLKNLFTPSSDKKPITPVIINLGNDGLKGHVCGYDIKTGEDIVPCWLYYTQGLRTYNQKEIIFFLRRTPNEKSYPNQPLVFFRLVSELAQQGQVVNVGEFTQFGEGSPVSLFGRHLVYILPPTFLLDSTVQNNVIVQDNAINAILVSEDEVIVAKEFGSTRLMSQLGYDGRYFPCPPWSDRTHTTTKLSLAKAREQSILNKIPRLRVHGMSVLYSVQQVVVRISTSIRQWLSTRLETLPVNFMLAFLTDLDPTANGCLVWILGQPSPSAITPPNSSGDLLSGCFVIFLPEQVQDHFRLVEDGVVIELTNQSWMRIWQALIEGTDLTLSTTKETASIGIKWLT